MKITRRQFLSSTAALGGVALLGFAESSNRRLLTSPFCIAVEEHFLTPQLLAHWQRLLAGSEPLESGFKLLYRPLLQGGNSNPLVQQLLELGPARLAAMDRAGVGMQVLSLTSPGVQVLNAALAGDEAARSNDFLAAAIQDAPPKRYAGFGCCAPQDPLRAAREIERCATHLGFVGMLINSHTQGAYLDEAHFTPIFEAMQAFDMPLYLHPQTPSPQTLAGYADYGLAGPAWGFAAEAGLHATRLIYSGLFERFPRLKVILGHLGEGLPWWLARMDNRVAITAKLSGKSDHSGMLPSEIFKRNFFVTTSGMTQALHLEFVLKMLDPEHVLFATDYPYEAMQPVIDMVEQSAIAEQHKVAIFYGNARNLLRLRPASSA